MRCGLPEMLRDVGVGLSTLDGDTDVAVKWIAVSWPRHLHQQQQQQQSPVQQ